MIVVVAVQPDEQGACPGRRGGRSAGQGRDEDVAAAVCGNQVNESVAVKVAVREAFAVLVVLAVDASCLQGSRVSARQLIFIEPVVAHMGYVQQSGAHRNVLECARIVAAHHATGCGEYVTIGAAASAHCGAEPVQVLVAVVLVVEERRAKTEIVCSDAGRYLVTRIDS